VLPSLARLEFPSDAYEVLVERGPSPSRNRNRGIAQSSGDVLAFVDDDCVVEPDWLARAAAFFDAHPEHEVVGGPQLTPPSDGVLARASGHALASRFGAWRMSRRYRQGRLDLDATETALTSANLFVRRTALARCGLFDPRLWPNEETELLHRIASTGGRLGYDPRVVVLHHRRRSLRGLAEQCFRYGTGRARQARITGIAPGAGVVIPLLFLVYLALLPMLLAVRPLAGVPLAVYAALVATWSVLLALRVGEPALVGVLPAAFVAIHLSYPAGYLVESVRLWLRGGLDARELGPTADGVRARG
jgi:cellulose synthase/poly-beta-1,6-N-acetylglucosamine synthase-like glycosyltransferase